MSAETATAPGAVVRSPPLIAERQSCAQAARLAVIDHTLSEKRAAVLENQAALTRIEGLLPLLDERRKIRQAGLRDEFGSRFDYLQVAHDYLDQQQEFLVQQHHLAGAEQAVTELEQQRRQTEEEYHKNLLIDLAKAETDIGEKTKIWSNTPRNGCSRPCARRWTARSNN